MSAKKKSPVGRGSSENLTPTKGRFGEPTEEKVQGE